MQTDYSQQFWAGFEGNPPLGAQNFFKKGLATARAFDTFTAPLRPKGRKDSMFADR
jgi:hypothetical protein